MIDTHCHLDLYPDPLSEAKRAERSGNIVVAVTNLPSYYELGLPHLRGISRVRLALGLHPLLADQHEKELELFVRLAKTADYIGEVGLDFSPEGYRNKARQIKSFRTVLSAISDRQRFVTLHSRRAELTVLNLLEEHGIKKAVFHWYTGSLRDLNAVLAAGHYISVNIAMVGSERGLKLISNIPQERILTETDGPYLTIGRRQIRVAEVGPVLDILGQMWGVDRERAEEITISNFRSITAL